MVKKFLENIKDTRFAAGVEVGCGGRSDDGFFRGALKADYYLELPGYAAPKTGQILYEVLLL